MPFVDSVANSTLPGAVKIPVGSSNPGVRSASSAASGKLHASPANAHEHYRAIAVLQQTAITLETELAQRKELGSVHASGNEEKAECQAPAHHRDPVTCIT